MALGKPAATRRSGLCAVCLQPCHATSPACRKCEQALVTEVEAFLADGRPPAGGAST